MQKEEMGGREGNKWKNKAKSKDAVQVKTLLRRQTSNIEL